MSKAMTTQQYNEYKDSGIAWLGSVPKHWEVKRLKYASTIRSGDAIQSKSQDCLEKFEVWGGNGFMGWHHTYNNQGNSIIIGRVGALCGNVHKSHYPIFVTDNALILTIKNSYNTDFVFFTLTARDLNSLNKSSAQPLITGTEVVNEFLPAPPLSEQEAIVRYLDERCGEIDQRIELERKRIELLTELKQSIITQAVTEGLDPNAPKRDSGVQWLGQIPQHWEVRKLKFVIHKIKSGGTPTSDNTDFYAEDGIPWVTIADMSNVEIVKETASRITEQGMLSKNLELHPQGTLLYSIYATIGKVALLGVPATTNQAILALYVKPQTIGNSYLRAVLTALEPVVLSETSSNTQNNLSASKVSNFMLPVPPLSEQEAIVSYIDERCGEIDGRIKRAKRKIELLTELKQSIITKAVTGKIKVC